MKNNFFWFLGGVIFLLTAGFGALMIIHADNPSDAVTVVRGNLVGEVKSTGLVVPAETSKLAFETSGKIVRVAAHEGDTVKNGQTLAYLDSSLLASQLTNSVAGIEAAKARVTQAEAQQAAAQAQLDGLRIGATPEAVAQAEATVTAAETAEKNAETALENTKNQTETAAVSAQTTALALAQTANTTIKSALSTLTDIQYAYGLVGSDQSSFEVGTAKAAAVESLFGVANTNNWDRTSIDSLSSGLYGQITAASLSNDYSTTEVFLNDLLKVLNLTLAANNSVPINETSNAVEISTINSELATINGEINLISSTQQSLNNLGATNQSTVDTAEAGVRSAQDGVNSAKATLAVILSGATEAQIFAAEAVVAQAEANVASIKAQLSQTEAVTQGTQTQISKTVLRAPFDGTVTGVFAKLGEFAVAGSPAVSLMSSSGLEVEVYVSQIELVKLKVGQPAEITLDAFNDQIFTGKIIEISSSETMTNNVATYKITLVFDAVEPQIVSGLTANVRIETEKKDNVLVVPAEAILRRDEKQFVFKIQDNKILEQEVETGLTENGLVEIVSGLNENETISLYGLTRE